MRLNIQELNRANPAPFNDFKLANLQHVTRERRLEYSTLGKQVGKADIRLSDIVGHNQMYNDLSWGKCLMRGAAHKRLTRNLEHLVLLPDYYRRLQNNAASLSFIRVEDKFYIATGKHRTIIMRYLAHFNPDVFGDDPILFNATLDEDRVIDYDFMSKRDKLEGIADDFGFTAHMRYTPRNSEEYCATLHGEIFPRGMISLKRKEILPFVHAMYHPAWHKKIKGDRFHQHATFMQNTSFSSLIKLVTNS